ncbi:hypothetical protein AHAS_Ahas13G0121500 [Arachis hypogaea]
MKTSLLQYIFIVVLDSATAASFSLSTSHGSFVIVVTAPSPLHPCKFKLKVSSFSFDFVLFPKTNWKNNIIMHIVCALFFFQLRSSCFGFLLLFLKSTVLCMLAC